MDLNLDRASLGFGEMEFSRWSREYVCARVCVWICNTNVWKCVLCCIGCRREFEVPDLDLTQPPSCALSFSHLSFHFVSWNTRIFIYSRLLFLLLTLLYLIGKKSCHVILLVILFSFMWRNIKEKLTPKKTNYDEIIKEYLSKYWQLSTSSCILKGSKH